LMWVYIVLQYSGTTALTTMCGIAYRQDNDLAATDTDGNLVLTYESRLISLWRTKSGFALPSDD
jgi:hypothetical protein